MKNRIKLFLIIILAAIIGFSMAVCNNDNGSTDDDDNIIDDNNDNSDNISSVTSLSVKTKNVKSLYLGNITVSGSARAVEDGNIPTLSYITEDGKNAPVVFTGPSGKQYMLEIMGMDRIDNTRVIVRYNGIYEVSAGEEGNIVGPKDSREGGALIDMNSGRVYESEETWMTTDNGDYTFNHSILFIENNICYIRNGLSTATIYRMDLTAASPQKVPLINGEFTPITTARPPFTIDGKIIGYKWDSLENKAYFYSIDSTGTLAPKTLTWATLPASTISDTPGVNYEFTLYSRWFTDSLIMKDLSGKTWMYTIYHLTNKGQDNEGYWSVLGDSGGIYTDGYYLIAQLNVDNNGNYRASNASKEQINFNGDTYNEGRDYLPFYVNAAGIALYQDENPKLNEILNLEAFLHNGVYLLNTKGFIKITKKQDGIEQTSAALDIPRLRKGIAVISKDGYLYWVEANAGIKRLKLESGAATETVYTNSNVIVSPASSQRESLTVSGDKLIFYQYITASLVNTYALDLNNPIYAPVKLLAANDVEIKAVAELDY